MSAYIQFQSNGKDGKSDSYRVLIRLDNNRISGTIRAKSSEEAQYLGNIIENTVTSAKTEFLEKGELTQSSVNSLIKLFKAECKKTSGVSENEFNISSNQHNSDFMLLVDFIKRWKREYADIDRTGYRKKDGLSAETRAAYYSFLKNTAIEKLLYKPLDQITREDVNGYINDIRARGSRKSKDGNFIPLAPTTLEHYFVMISSIFSKAVEWNIIKESPCIHSDKPERKEKKRDMLTDEQVRVLLDAIDLKQLEEKYLIGILIALHTGMRRGEIAGLIFSDLDFKHSCIHVSRSTYRETGGINRFGLLKTSESKRKIGLTPEIMGILENYMEKEKARRIEIGRGWNVSDALFLADKLEGDFLKFRILDDMGTVPGLINKDIFSDKFADLRKKYPALEGIRLHDLRHNHISRLFLTNLVDVLTIMKRAGHTNLQTTLRYAHGATREDMQAAQAFSNSISRVS